MSALPTEQETGYPQMLSRAWPVILANSAVPLLGLVDTAVIGNTGSVAELGAIALGALIFSFLFWGFGFLRMGTTGFTAQAEGAGDSAEVRAILGRALLVAAAAGVLLLVLQLPLRLLALHLFDASADVERSTADYIRIRIWGAPAALASFAMMGALIGLGLTRHLLLVQLFMNGLNILLDLLFAGVFGWGVQGIALGSALAEWSACLLAAAMLWRVMQRSRRDKEPFWPGTRIARLDAALHMLSANRDLMIRTLLMLFCFAWFTNAGARFGDTVLAANHILIQFVSFSAYFLDGYAFVAEGLVGRAVGRRNAGMLDGVVRRSSLLAAATAVLLALLMLVAGSTLIQVLAEHEPVRAVANNFLPYAALYVLLSFAAFQLDGIFIGATRHAEMRNASALSAAGFLLLAWPFAAVWGNQGLWLAFIAYVVIRALSLARSYPAIRRNLEVVAPSS